MRLSRVTAFASYLNMQHHESLPPVQQRRCRHLLRTLPPLPHRPAPSAAAAASAASKLRAEDGDILISTRSRWAALPRSPGSPICHVASLIPLDAEQLRRIEACGAGSGAQVSVTALSEKAVKLLRRSNSNPAEGAESDAVATLTAAEVTAALAEIDDVLGSAEVWLGTSWDTVPGSKHLANTRFPPSLRWLALSQGGAGHIAGWLQDEGKPPDALAVTNVSGMHAQWIGEFALGFMLSHAMRLPRLMQQQRDEVWAMRPTGQVRGSVVLVVGLGAIGEEIGRLCQAHGATVLATRRTVEAGSTADGLPCDELHPASELHGLLPRADFVVLATPGTEETAALIGAAELALMKPSSVLVNVSRGATVDWDAMERALRDEPPQLAACYSDVAPIEPLPAGHPLWRVPGLYLTPHNSGNPDGVGGEVWEWQMPRRIYSERALDYFCAQLRRYVRGEPVFNVIDNASGY